MPPRSLLAASSCNSSSSSSSASWAATTWDWSSGAGRGRFSSATSCRSRAPKAQSGPWAPAASRRKGLRQICIPAMRLRRATLPSWTLPLPRALPSARPHGPGIHRPALCTAPISNKATSTATAAAAAAAAASAEGCASSAASRGGPAARRSLLWRELLWLWRLLLRMCRAARCEEAGRTPRCMHTRRPQPCARRHPSKACTTAAAAAPNARAADTAKRMLWW
mmetsp:Transcript_135255/g.432383  ORF Transcript_135255/g.432383 Transcript_135255/m.432383 type:complete len:223 (+) Transcript_135255:656-1324(+)